MNYRFLFCMNLETNTKRYTLYTLSTVGSASNLTVARQHCDILRSRAIGHEVNFCSL